MMNKMIAIAVLLLFLADRCTPWKITSFIKRKNHGYRVCSLERYPVIKMMMIEDGVGLTTLQSVEKEGQFLKSSIVRWLNDEYIPLEVHSIIGSTVADCYRAYRSEGVDDLGVFLMRLGTDLEKKVDFYEAFVNAWDVANYSSDLLLLLMNSERCDCASNLKTAQQIAIDLGLLLPPEQEDRPGEALMDLKAVGTFQKVQYDRLCAKYNSPFSRFCYLQQFLQGS